MSSDQHVKNDAGLQDSLSTCATGEEKKKKKNPSVFECWHRKPNCLLACKPGFLLTPDTKLKTHLVDSDRFISPPIIWSNPKQWTAIYTTESTHSQPVLHLQECVSCRSLRPACARHDSNFIKPGLAGQSKTDHRCNKGEKERQSSHQCDWPTGFFEGFF